MVKIMIFRVFNNRVTRNFKVYTCRYNKAS
jgi:hypothetical protein